LLDIFTTECYSEVDGGGGPEQWNAQFVRDGLSGKVSLLWLLISPSKILFGSPELTQVTSANIWIPEANPPPITFLNSGYNIVVCALLLPSVMLVLTSLQSCPYQQFVPPEQ
jgi:hypothetical protein